MKRLFVSIILLILILFCVGLVGCDFFNGNNHGSTNDNANTEGNAGINEVGFDFTLINNGTEYEISGKEVVKENINIPAKYNGIPVTTIAKNAFTQNRNIKTISIPNSIIRIKENAFNFTNIKSIRIPNSVKIIESGAFAQSGLENIIFEENSKLESLGGWAFRYCSSLKEVNLPESITVIEDQLFENCTSLSNINFSDNIEAINHYAFSGCESLEEITLSNKLSTIGDYAFSECEKLNEVVLPNSLTAIGTGAFSDCIGLSEIIITDMLKSVGRGAFAGCSRINNIVFNVKSGWKQLPSYYEGIDESVANWTNISVSNSSNNALYMTTSSVLYSKIQRFSNVVCFNSTGGSLVDSVVVDNNSTVTEPQLPNKVGYRFTGWYKDENCLSKWNFEKDKVTSDTMLYAGWSALETYTVTYKDGNDIFATRQVYENECAPILNPSKKGYTFDCWKYQNTEFDFSKPLNNDIILQAEWSINSYKIEFIANNETLATFNVDYLDSLENIPGVPIKEGYEGKWDKSDFTLIEKDMTVKAIYTPKTYVARYNYNGVVFGNSPTTITLTYGKKINKIVELEKTGYSVDVKFNGINITSNTIWDKDIGEEIVFDVNYVANTYNIIFDYDKAVSGNDIERIVLTYDEQVGVLPSPVKTGYTFSGWDCNGQIITSDTIWNVDTDENIVFRAQYTIKSFIAILDYCGATGENVVTSVSLTYNEVIGDLPYPKKEGYLFSCWQYGNVDIEETNIWNYDVEGEIVFKAKYCSTADVFVFTQNSDNTYSVSANKENINSVERIIIPNSHNGLPVTIIGESAFYECNKLKKVEIPNTIITIENDAFNSCEALSTIDFENSSNLSTIGDSAFSHCRMLRTITIPKSVISIKESAFFDCWNLKQIIFEEASGLESIGERAFGSCAYLPEITIPASVNSIEEQAFRDCDRLVHIRNLSSVKLEDVHLSPNNAWSGVVGREILTNETDEFKNKLYIDSNGVQIFVVNDLYHKGSYLFDYLGESETLDLSSYTELDYVWTFAFYKKELKSIILPSTIKEVGYWSFARCKAENISFGSNSGLRIIRDYAFYQCENLVTITLGDKNNLTFIGENAFMECSSMINITIPNSVTSIQRAAFSGCISLERVNYTGTIDQWVQIDFKEYSNPLFYAEGLYINNNLITTAYITKATKISDYAFYGYSSMTGVEIRDSVTSIGERAFSNCSSLVRVVVGSKVTAISKGAFYNCNSLESIAFSDTSTWYETTSYSSFVNKTGGTKISVTTSSSNAKYFRLNYSEYWYKT